MAVSRDPLAERDTSYLIYEKDEAALVAQIKSLAAARGAGCLMAISETDLMMLNRHRGELEQIVTVHAPPADQLATVIDKVV